MTSNHRSLRTYIADLLIGALSCFGLGAPSLAVDSTNHSHPELALQAGHYGSVAAASFSPDGRLIVTGGDDWNVKLWNPNTGEVERTLIGHTTAVTSLSFAPDGKSLASGSEDASVKLWNMTSGALRKSLVDPDLYPVTAISFSPDRRLLASGVGSGGQLRGKIRVWDLAKMGLKQTIKEESEGVTGLVFSSDSKTLISSSKDGKLKLWNPNTGALERQIEAHGNEITSLTSVRNGTLIASASLDGTVKLWQMPTFTLKRSITVENNEKNEVAFSPDGKELLIGNSEVGIFDPVSGTLLRLLEKKTLNSNGVFFSPDGRTVMNLGVATGVDVPNAEVHLWNAETASFNRKLSGYTTGVISVLLSLDKSRVVVGDSYRRVTIWNLQTGSPTKTIPQPADIKSLTASPDGKYLASAGGDLGQPGFLSICEMKTGTFIRSFPAHPFPVRAAAFSPNGKSLASGGEDGAVRLWNVETGALEKTLKDNNLPVLALIFSSDGHSVITGSFDGKVRIWNLKTETVTTTLKGQTSAVFVVVLSRDGSLLASGGSNTSAINVWDLNSGKLKTSIRNSLLSPTSMAFLSNSRLAVSNANGRVNLWDLDSGKMDRELTIHELNASSIAISYDHSYLISGSHDNSVRFLDLGTNKLMAILHNPRPEDLARSENATTPPNVVGEYFIITDKGFYIDSPIADLAVRLRIDGKVFPANHFHAQYYRPNLVREALRLQ